MSSHLKLIPGAIVKHYKGPHYLFTGCVIHTETQEKLACYRSLYPSTDPKFDLYQSWARPLDMFLEKVEYEGKIVSRFEVIAHTDQV